MKDGGGIYVSGTSASVEIVASTLDSNTARRNGGFANVYQGSLGVTESVIANGTAVYDGAAVYSKDTVSIANSIVTGFGSPEEEECYDSNHGASNFYALECSYYDSHSTFCSDQYDDFDFTAHDMCCWCGGGSATWQHNILYHTSSAAILSVDSSTFQNSELAALNAEYAETVVIRNCEGLAIIDMQGSDVLDCDTQEGYCLADYCTDTEIGFEVRARVYTSDTHNNSMLSFRHSATAIRMASKPTQIYLVSPAQKCPIPWSGPANCSRC